MVDFLSILCLFVAMILFSSTPLAKRASNAPALTLSIGAIFGILILAFQLPILPVETAAFGAKALLAALGFACAAELRVSKLAKLCPSSWRLTLGGAPLFLLACSLSAYVMLPQLTWKSALLLGGVMTVNGAAFDKRAVINTPAPAAIKAAVRYESAAIIALGIPVIILLVAFATAPQPNEASLAPLMSTSLSVLTGFAFGGSLGLLAAYTGAAYRRRTLQTRALDGQIAVLTGLISFSVAPTLGADPIVAATACGLLWGEQTSSAATTRLRVRRFAERIVRPLAYFGFGLLITPRLFQADLLTIVFALAIVTIIRVAPRLAVLQSPSLARESQFFLAWFGGAPGAASALFAITLLGNPALYQADAVLIVAALAITIGIFGARLTSRPLANAYLRETALAKKRRLFGT